MGDKLQMMVNRHNEYMDDRNNKHEAINDMNERMRKMEEQEQRLISQLAVTTQKQHATERQVKTIVNQGQEYYKKVAKNRFDSRWEKPKVVTDNYDTGASGMGADSEFSRTGTVEATTPARIKEKVDFDDIISNSNPQGSINTDYHK